MEDTNRPPYQSPGPAPTAAYPAPAYATGGGTTSGTKSSKGRTWVIIGVIAAVLFSTCGCCAFAVSLFPRGDIPALGDAVAIIHVDGVIASSGDYYSGYVTPEWMLDQLDQAAADPSVKAVVLRIDSPGGTVAASQDISMEIARFDKPVIASIGDIGASGAYMIASQCDYVVAAPGSGVGSIGVIMEVPNIEGLLEKLGVEFTVLSTGEFKDTGSPYRPVTPTETAMFEEQLEIDLDQFVEDVAYGRGMSEEEVRELATGWLWTGTEALDLGLVDELGNYADALDIAADMGGIEGEYDLVYYDEVTFDEFFYSLFGLSEQLDEINALLSGERQGVTVPK